MARKAKKKQKTARERPAWMRSFSFRAAGGLVLSLAGVGAAGWGVAVVHARADSILAAQPTGVEIEWPALPGAESTWMGEALREQITAMVDAQLVGRALDALALAAVGEMLTGSGWFDGRPGVHRTGDASIGIRGVWREPACVLRSGMRDYALDWKGRPFPIDYPAGSSGMRAILGVGAGVPLRGGVLDVLNPWPGEDVSAALELLAPLLREPFADQVAGIDVTDYYTAGELAIVTDRDTRVVWGGRYGEFIPGEKSSEEKLSRLRAAHANPGYQHRIDGGQQMMDVSGEHLILDRTRQP